MRRTIVNMTPVIPMVFGSVCFFSACCPTPDSRDQHTHPPQESEQTKMTVPPATSKSTFGLMPDGTEIFLFTLTNSNGINATITNYGGVITSLSTRDRQGNFTDIVLGFDEFQPYLDGTPYFGALIGRFGNRIDDAQFELNGEPYQLVVNDGKNHLHGGAVGFDKRVWSAEPFTTDAAAGLRLHLVSEDGDQGYPGTLRVTATYYLTNDDELITEFQAVTDKATPVNLTQHTYFNLAGAGSMLDHIMMINADQYTPIDDTLIPTGEIAPVAGTPFDFTSPKAIGTQLNEANEQLKRARGYDHNFILNKTTTGTLAMAASVYEPQSGRVLEVWTTEPAIQFYSGNFLDGSLRGKNRVYEYRTGFCLEPQHYPDSPNQPDFPNTILQPGDEYNTRMSFRFSTRDQ